MKQEYLSTLPAVVPAGKVLVHNQVTGGITPHRRIGTFGFRVWLSPKKTPRLEVCDCCWAPQLGTHFRVKL